MALPARGAFRFLWVLVALCFWFVPADAQTSKTSKPTSTKSSAKPASKKSNTRRRPVRRRARAQTAPTADRIKEIQAALAKSGHYPNEPSGKWDAASTAALKRFQEQNGLKPTGKLNARSLQLLGLGSETAGVAPPREPAAADSGSGR